MPTSSATSWIVVAWYPFALNSLAAAAMISLVRGVLMRSPSTHRPSRVHRCAPAQEGREPLKGHSFFCPPILTKHLVKSTGLKSVRPLSIHVNGFSREVMEQRRGRSTHRRIWLGSHS